MEEAAVPLPEPRMTGGLPPHRLKQKLLKAALPFVAVIAVVIIGLVLAGSNKPKTSPAAAHLLVDNTAQSKISLTSASGQLAYSVSYPKFSYLNFEAASPKGELLLSSGITTSGESYLFIVDGKAKALPPAATKTLRSAIVLDSSHRLFFTDENDVIYVSCPASAACQLNSLNLISGQTKPIINTGAKPIIAQLPPVYPLGLSTDRQTVYLRTLGSNKLGQSAAAVYAVKLNGKVVKNWDMPLNADYTPSLAPDVQQIVYKESGNNSVKLSVLNLSSGKTSSSNWSGEAINDLPSSLAWSPDSKKVVFWGSQANAPHATPNTSFDTNIAFLDTSNNSVTNLLMVKDSSHNQVGALGWLDSSNVIYNQDTTSKAFDFSQPDSQIYKLSISTKTANKLNNLPGSLKQVVYY